MTRTDWLILVCLGFTCCVFGAGLGYKTGQVDVQPKEFCAAHPGVCIHSEDTTKSLSWGGEAKPSVPAEIQCLESNGSGTGEPSKVPTLNINFGTGTKHWECTAVCKSLPAAVKVPALIAVFKDEEGALRATVRFDPKEGIPLGTCLDLLAQTVIEAIERLSRERAVEGMSSLVEMRMES